MADKICKFFPTTKSTTSREYCRSQGYGFLSYEDDQDVPIITLEVISDCDSRPDHPQPEPPEAEDARRSELLEYAARPDGGVVCRLCGEVLPSRTHWYRHKYKRHVPALAPAPLYQCDTCLVYFKSRKGYIGHLSSRHGDADGDGGQPAPAVVITPVRPADCELEVKTRAERRTRPTDEIEVGWEERRSREEKLVADIIARVRRECEAAGGGGAARRGYTRRTTVMHS